MYKTASRYLQHVASLGRPTIEQKRNGQGKRGVPKKIRQAFHNNQVIKARISHEIKGGYAIKIKGFTAFCPYSEMYPKPSLMGALRSVKPNDLEFLILKVDLNSVIVSRKKAAQLRAWEQAKRAYCNKLTLRGSVKEIKQYGAFIDIGGMDGLLHVSEMKSGRENQEIILKAGQMVNVYVIGVNEDLKRISLSMFSPHIEK